MQQAVSRRQQVAGIKSQQYKIWDGRSDLHAIHEFQLCTLFGPALDRLGHLFGELSQAHGPIPPQ